MIIQPVEGVEAQTADRLLLKRYGWQRRMLDAFGWLRRWQYVHYVIEAA
ncbi:hypothetical protein HC891_18660 [Candidatus Gracilibacteria bacterium]|nr:hypothetical protein [Candidatus Gracilibacteria bacterium]